MLRSMPMELSGSRSALPKRKRDLRQLEVRRPANDNPRTSPDAPHAPGESKQMSKPLEGIKIIEIAQEIQGPFSALFLADLGASITKVENRETGDLSRWLLAGLIGGPNVKNAGISHYYIAMNRGKRSITVDLKKKAGVEIVRRMARDYDVLLTNHRPGVLDRLGLGYEDLRVINPRLIYAQASSWGPKGPWVSRPSRDTLAQAASGLMSKTGMPNDPPLAAGAALADQSGALTLAGGVLAARFAPATATYVSQVSTTSAGPTSAASWESSRSSRIPNAPTIRRAISTAAKLKRYLMGSFRRRVRANGSRSLRRRTSSRPRC